MIYGCREWTDLQVDARLRIDLARSGGIAVRVQGMERYYALLLTATGMAQLVKRRGKTTVLAQSPFSWSFGDTIDFRLSVVSDHLVGTINGTTRLSATDHSLPLTEGAVGIVVGEGRIGFEEFRIGEVDR